ncbi:ARM repeat-containing protein, partial [Rozella allomycis CSF55]
GLEKYMLLVQWGVTVFERHSVQNCEKKSGKKSKGDIWGDLKEEMLIRIRKLMNLGLNRLWTSSPERDVFMIYYLMENVNNVKKNGIKVQMQHIISVLVKKYGYGEGAKTGIKQNLNYFEHLGEAMAEMVEMIVVEYGSGYLIDDLLDDIHKSEIKGEMAKTFSKFLIKISELLPKETLKNMSKLIEFLDDENYVMRCGIVEILGNVINGYLIGEKDEHGVKQMKTFYTILEERYHDVNAFVRSKVMSVMSGLCEGNAMLISKRRRVLELTCERLKDKNSNVRKKAVQLIKMMIKTHPFCLDGGELDDELFKRKYEELKERLEREMNLGMNEIGFKFVRGGEVSVEGSKESKESSERKSKPSESERESKPSEREPSESLTDKDKNLTRTDELHLNEIQLQIKYYKDAIEFVGSLKQVGPIVQQMMGSTNKAEIIEAIDLIVLFYVYKIEKKSEMIKRMVHLIWFKENSNSVVGEEEEKKSLKEHLINCFREILMKDLNVKEIGMNLIKIINECKMAELISFEELISLMALKEMFNENLINVFWGLFSNLKIELNVRRGSIIILSMICKVKKEMIKEKMEIILRLGFEDDSIISKYSCIILQRSSNFNKLKKTNLNEDYGIRWKYDNLIFNKLKLFCINQCNKEEWLPVIEQIFVEI